MSRFDATTPADRRELYRDGVAAHRERAGGVLTLDVDAASLGGDGPDPELGVPWVQYEAAPIGDDPDERRDGQDLVRLDCTDAELERTKELLREYPEFTIDELLRPEDAEGTNVVIRGRADAGRLAEFFEGVFRRVYGCPEAVRVWVTSV